MPVAFVDMVLAFAVLITSIGIGRLVYTTRVEQAKAKAMPVGDEDLVAVLRSANADTIATAKEGAAMLEKAVQSIRAGVR